MASSTFALDFLRRLLCAHTASNAGSSGGRRGSAECGGDDGAVVQCQVAPGGAAARSPCVVARLMGLDAMPPDCQPLLRRRSRSVSSAEGWPPPPQREIPAASASLREKTAYVREESDEFLVLSFSPEAARHACDGRRRDVGAKKQSSSRPRRKLHYGGGDDEAQSSGHGKRRTAATECGMQSSSPVSVLHTQQTSSSSSTTTTTTTTSCSSEEVEPSSPSPTSEEIRLAANQQSSRRKLQPDFDDDLDNLLFPAVSTCHVSKCSDRERRNRSVVNKAEVITPNVSCTSQFICRLVEEDLNSVRWLTSDSKEDISADIGSEILSQLICETADELMQTSSETVHSLPSSKVVPNMQTIRGY
ncbi:hypothetical protein E2562_003306 [Oryza meyeriana var. granulata]|uniref:DUF3741 domain-containing protein n=1 Tax=Oryza meyeriana var. granulata TaxID=110450 RepID=A0A6G1EE91_9ORYZ|nr:hypothetical protein E2562_003306 [Oryza meyeriana var. granulata]